MSDEPKPEKPAATPEAIDPKDVRAQLGLPENATDADVIAGLLAVIAALSQKYETLLADSAGQEAEIANRTLVAYADRIPAGTADFWRDQLLANRAATVAVFENLPKPAAAPAAEPAPAPKTHPVPLRNRLPAAPPDRPPVPDQPGAILAHATATNGRVGRLEKWKVVLTAPLAPLIPIDDAGAVAALFWELGWMTGFEPATLRALTGSQRPQTFHAVRQG